MKQTIKWVRCASVWTGGKPHFWCGYVGREVADGYPEYRVLWDRWRQMWYLQGPDDRRIGDAYDTDQQAKLAAINHCNNPS